MTDRVKPGVQKPEMSREQSGPHSFRGASRPRMVEGVGAEVQGIQLEPRRDAPLSRSVDCVYGRSRLGVLVRRRDETFLQRRVKGGGRRVRGRDQRA